MADERIIQQADLTKIAENLGVVHEDLRTINSGVGTVNDNVKVVYDEIGALAQEFHDFANAQMRANRLGQAETRLVKIRNELKTKYGHYDVVRRTTTGILQADDLGIVKRDTISNAAEELMISTPGYWLSPCLVALAAWINDQRELAEKAVREGIKRNDEKTSLFFALVCRRANRKQTSLKWTQRYLANQDEEDLDRKTVIILDAFASGLMGADSEGVISRQMEEWLTHLKEKTGFVEQQTKQWSEAINLKKNPINSSSYTYLKNYSKTWPVLDDIMEGAHLHAEIFNYLTNIFEQEVSTTTIKEQLDEILTSLVTDFDDEELPLRKQEKYEQFVVDFEGDEKRAQQNMNIEQTAFDTHKDFTQLLTDAAMKPETSHSSVSTQKFALALSKEWFTNAYNDVIAQNRMKIPNEIEINVENFNAKTKDGQNENQLINSFDALIKSEKNSALEEYVLSAFEKFCLYGGGTITIIGIFMLVTGSTFLGLIASIAGAGMMINHFSKKKKNDQYRKQIEMQFKSKQISGEQIIRATLAEIVDFRMEFANRDRESQKVIDFLEQITPDQYVKKLANSNRRIKITSRNLNE